MILVDTGAATIDTCVSSNTNSLQFHLVFHLIHVPCGAGHIGADVESEPHKSTLPLGILIMTILF
jgi:hypothetical protein